MGAKGPRIRDDCPAAALRRLSAREADRAKTRRMRAIASVEGMTRAEAAWLAGMEQQALRDAVMRHNAEGLAGLCDRPRPGPRPGLTGAPGSRLSSTIRTFPVALQRRRRRMEVMISTFPGVSVIRTVIPP